jgi:hypothetical protein
MHLDKYTDPDGTLECMVRSDEAKAATRRMASTIFPLLQAVSLRMTLHDADGAARAMADVFKAWTDYMERNA